MNSISKLWRKLRNKEYRDGYTEAQLSIEVPFQIRALRKARGWTQAQLAERCGMPQARISHIEQPGRDPLSLRTLYRLASAFDVGLLAQFVPFSELVHREAAFDPETFRVSSFEDDRLDWVAHATDASVTSISLTTEYTLGIRRAQTTPEQIEGRVRPLVGFLPAEDLVSNTTFSPPVPITLKPYFSTIERTHYDYEEATG